MPNIKQYELPSATGLADNSAFSGSDGDSPGDDKKYLWSTIKNVLKTIFQTLPNELLSGGQISVSGNDVTIQSAVYRLSGASVSSALLTVNLAFSTTGKQRYALFYGDASGSISVVEGNEATIASLPDRDLTKTLLGYVLIGSAAIGSASTDMSGFALKAELGNPSDLNTVQKNNLVDAANELNANVNSLQSDQTTLSVFKVSNYATL